MQGKIIRKLNCKLSGRVYLPDEVYEGTPERIKDLEALGYVVPIIEQQIKKEAVEVKQEAVKKQTTKKATTNKKTDKK